MEQEKTIKDYSDVELKAMAYDFLVNIETNQNNLKVINGELTLRRQPPVEPMPTVDEEIKEEVKEI